MGSGYVTPEQVEQAKSVDLIDYLRRSEPGNLIPSIPGEYKLKDHDSLKISRGKFHWFSRGIGGKNAIDYLVKVRGLEFQEAVMELVGDGGFISHTAYRRAPPEKKVTQKNEARSFALPEPNNNNSEAIDYLIGRGIEESVIQDCIREGLLYQNTKQACVFVGFDSQDTAKYASVRGIGLDYKKDVAGSNKAFGFCMQPSMDTINGRDTDKHLYVFESAIDCMSHASIAEIGDTDWDGFRLSLGGVSNLALYAFLENNPQVETVYLCLDNDKAGKEASERIATKLLDNELYDYINIFIAPPPIGNDFNDTLLAMKEKIKQRNQQNEKNEGHETPKPIPGKKRTVAER